MARPRKQQINNPQTKYTKYVHTDHAPSQLGQSTWTLRDIIGFPDYTNFSSAMVTSNGAIPTPGGVEADTPASIVSTWVAEPYIGWVTVGKKFHITLPGVNGGAPVAITFQAGDFTTLFTFPTALTTAVVVNRINADLALAVPPPASNVASRDENGRIVLTSVDATGVTYGDSAQITIADDPLFLGVISALGLAAPGVSTLTVNGITAPKRGVVTESVDRRGGVIPTRFENGAVAVTRTNSAKFIGYNAPGLPVYVPDIVGGKKITARLTHDSTTPAWVVSCTAPGMHKLIRSYKARIFDILPGDIFDITYDQYGVTSLVSIGPGIPTGPSMTNVAAAINTQWNAVTGTGYAVCHGQNAEAYNFDSEVLDIEWNGTAYAITMPSGLQSAAGIAAWINAVGHSIPALPANLAFPWTAPDGDHVKLVDTTAGLKGEASIIKVLPGVAAAILGFPARKHTGVEIAFANGEELILKCPGSGDDAFWVVANNTGFPLTALGITTTTGVRPTDEPAALFNARDETENLFSSIRWLVPESMSYGDIPSMEDTEVVRELTEIANIHIDPNNSADQGGQPLFAEWDGSLPFSLGGSNLIGYTNSLTPFNTALGRGAGGAGGIHTTGTNSVFLGYHAGLSLTTGVDNVIIGSNAATVATTIASNVIIGEAAGSNLTTVSHDSVIIGKEAGYKYTTDCVNSVMVGSQAGYNMTVSMNTAIGYQAMYGSGAGTGSGNVAIGSQALPTVSTGFSNIAIGGLALYQLTTGSANVAIGDGALSGATGSNNVGVGQSVGLSITGTNNVFIGFSAVGESTGGTAENNVVIGSNAGYKLYNGNRNVTIGSNAGNVLNATSETVAVGSDALSSLNTTNGSGAVAIGDSALMNWTPVIGGSASVAIGRNASKNSVTARHCTVVGPDAGTDNTGNWCTALGRNAAVGNSGDDVVAIGNGAMFGNSGDLSVAIGSGALTANTADYCVAVGNSAASLNTGHHCVAIGAETASFNSGVDCIAIGSFAAYDNRGNNSIAIGVNAAYGDGISAANYVVAIGYEAAYLNDSDYVVAIGYEAASSSTGSECIAIGSEAARGSNGDYGICIGYKAGQSAMSDYQISIGYSANKTNIYNNCVAIGRNAGMNNGQAAVGGDWCVFIGDTAGQNNGFSASAANCIAIGRNAGYQNSANNCVAVGYSAAHDNTGNETVALGTYAAYGNSGSATIAIGDLSAQNNTGNFCIAIGAQAAQGNLGTSDCIAIGGSSLASNSGTESIGIGNSTAYDNAGSDCIAIGWHAAYSNQGGYHIAIGYNAGIGGLAIFGENNISIGSDSDTSGDASIAIGYQAVAQGNNAIQLGTGTNPTPQDLQVGSAGLPYDCHAFSWVGYSDIRMKTSIRDLSTNEGLSFVEALRPVNYELKNPGNEYQKLPRFGLIAQEVEQAAINAGIGKHGVIDRGDTEADVKNVWSLDYDQFVAPLIKAVQELSSMVKSQQAEIEDLKKKVG